MKLLPLKTPEIKAHEAFSADYSGMKHTFDGFCRECDDYVDAKAHKGQHSGHNVRILDLREREAAVIYNLTRYG